jgi:hypothetical protein
MEPWLTGALIGGAAGGLAALVLTLATPQRKCPDCGEPIPRFRRPANRRQALWGGGTCPKCGCEVDRRGRKIEKE